MPEEELLTVEDDEIENSSSLADEVSDLVFEQAETLAESGEGNMTAIILNVWTDLLGHLLSVGFSITKLTEMISNKAEEIENERLQGLINAESSSMTH